ncbi:DUF3310 domain-containing protein [Herbaspirillum sp. DW155]|uniref:DUF3310 domain-containing protein n=1 Tax=Herbaspirillum sp. DW155 TaxID=3095609 RepID=UPI0030858CF8|nr:DUF3310 domain-containing protein [Herbaspirillum sp. DW155]
MATRRNGQVPPQRNPGPPSAKDRQVGGSHYKDMALEPWEAIEKWMTPEQVRGYHKATAIAYLAREGAKGGDEDIAKAAHHLQRLVEINEQLS